MHKMIRDHVSGMVSTKVGLYHNFEFRRHCSKKPEEHTLMMTSNNKIYKLGTRDSPLALWQAQTIQNMLLEVGVNTELIPVKSEGDLDLVTPLYAMGVQGVFSKTLDAWLLSGHIDLAVHSMKDVPVQLAEGIVQAAVPLRAATQDIIVWRDGPLDEEELSQGIHTIGTGSIRRSSFWRHRYPEHRHESLRGNIQTRLRKLKESQWVGAIFAQAGLARMGLDESLQYQSLDWMLPAPAQGALMVVCRQDEPYLQEQLQQINDIDAELCTRQERSFLELLHGGCSAPVGALATIREEAMHFRGAVCSLDGSEMLEVEKSFPLDQAQDIGQLCAEQLLAEGADRIIEEIRRNLQ